jgi:putative DNA primase/helicase
MIAERLLSRLEGVRQSGSGKWMARCPAHNDNTPSLSIAHGTSADIVVHCHAGCSQDSVIKALRLHGLWGKSTNSSHRHTLVRKMEQTTPSKEGAKATLKALSIWDQSVAIKGTLVERYLASRGLQNPETISLRFHPSLRHPCGVSYPAMIGLVTHAVINTPTAIHRTFLQPDGSGKAPVTPSKMMLGPCRGGVIRLTEGDHFVMIGEGIETCLAAMQSTGYPAWAAMSASGFNALDLPPQLVDIIILADADAAGEVAARTAASRWAKQGRRVRIARPPQGCDFNDLLQVRSHAKEVTK